MTFLRDASLSDCNRTRGADNGWLNTPTIRTELCPERHTFDLCSIFSVAAGVEVMSRGLEKFMIFHMLVSYSPNSRSHEVRRISAM